MTTIYLENGKPIIHNNKIGIDKSCCCATPTPTATPLPTEPPPGCVCPENCVNGLSISLGGNPSCIGGTYSDSIACDNGGNIDASMSCINGIWKVAVQIACFTPENDFCFAQYGADLQCDNNNLPPAGNVNLTLIQTNIPNCFPVPNVIVIRP